MSDDKPGFDRKVDYEDALNVGAAHSGAVKREKEISAPGSAPMPTVAIIGCFFVILIGGVYMGGNFGGLGMGQYNKDGDQYSAGLPPGGEIVDAPPVPPGELGKKIYAGKGACASCHQPQGQGLPGIYPPLAKSEWVTGGNERLIMILLNGLTGPITVAGKSYPGTILMPAQKDTLKDDEIAAVVTYIREAFNGQEGNTTPEQVAAARAKYASKAGAFTVVDLEKVPADQDLPGGGE